MPGAKRWSLAGRKSNLIRQDTKPVEHDTRINPDERGCGTAAADPDSFNETFIDSRKLDVPFFDIYTQGKTTLKSKIRRAISGL
jgi:hypothetical protein